MTTDKLDFESYRNAVTFLKSLKDDDQQAVRHLLIAEPQTDEELLETWKENLQDPNYLAVPYETARKIRDAVKDLIEAPYNLGRDHLTNLAMDLSLCPVHFVDWAICFDDKDPECIQIQRIFPNSHDT